MGLRATALCMVGCTHADVDLELAQVGGMGKGKGFHVERRGGFALVHAMGFAAGTRQ
jgi:hypothetical protein